MWIKTSFGGSRPETSCDSCKDISIRPVNSDDLEDMISLVMEVQTKAYLMEAFTHLKKFFCRWYPWASGLIIFQSIRVLGGQNWFQLAFAGVMFFAVMELIKLWNFLKKVKRIFRFPSELRDPINFYNKPKRVFLVAVKNGRVIGTAGVKEQEDSDAAKLWRIFVHPQHRRMRVASRLISSAFEECRRMQYSAVELRTHATNQGAVRCYVSCGFSQRRRGVLVSIYPHKFESVDFRIELTSE